MERANNPGRRGRRLLRAGLVMSGLLAGCVARQSSIADKCAELPQGAIPQPAGTHLHEITSRQAAKAEADDFVIYLYEWRCGTELGPFGSYHLHQIVKRLPEVPFPVLIQADLDKSVNELRRQIIVHQLFRAGVTDAMERVVVGFPAAEGLNGEEAERIFLRLLFPQNFGGGGFNNLFGSGFGNVGNLGSGGLGGGLGGGGLGGGFGGIGGR